MVTEAGVGAEDLEDQRTIEVDDILQIGGIVEHVVAILVIGCHLFTIKDVTQDFEIVSSRFPTETRGILTGKETGTDRITQSPEIGLLTEGITKARQCRTTNNTPYRRRRIRWSRLSKTQVHTEIITRAIPNSRTSR